MKTKNIDISNYNQLCAFLKYLNLSIKFNN